MSGGGFTCGRCLGSPETQSAERAGKDALLIEPWKPGLPLYNCNNPHTYTQSLMCGLREMNYYFKM